MEIVKLRQQIEMKKDFIMDTINKLNIIKHNKHD